MPGLQEASAGAPPGLPDEDELRNQRDLETIEALRSGSIEANVGWKRLIDRHRSRIFSLAYRFTGRFEEAEELTHEIFVRVFRQLDHFDPRAHFAVWLNSVARNHCIDHYRSRVRDRQRIVPDDFAFDQVRASPASDPLRIHEQGEARGVLLAALERLSPKLQQVVRMRFFQELTYEEMCERLGVPEGTVKSRIHRGRAELRRRLVAAGATADGAPGRKDP